MFSACFTGFFGNCIPNFFPKISWDESGEGRWVKFFKPGFIGAVPTRPRPETVLLFLLHSVYFAGELPYLTALGPT